MLKKLEFIIAILMLGYAVWFNLDLYRLEPTATTDPNDNNFQFGLVDRANQIWDFANRECAKQFILVRPVCHLAYMTDHWVPNWAQGYNLPFYYSHVPQIVIVGTYKVISPLINQLTINHQQLTLFSYYHWIIYLLLCFFPIPVFLALRVIGAPWIISGAGAIFAAHISTDGLYGLDPPSFLWRGWGLSSQLYAMIFLPLALAYAFRYLTQTDNIALGYAKIINSNFWLAVIFTVCATMGHLGIGTMLFLSIGAMAIAVPLSRLISQEKLSLVWESTVTSVIRLALVAGLSIFFLSYWIVPTVLSNNFHNVSLWDPVWKFDSYGWKETVIRFFNGDLLDFGRFQVMTILTLVGFFTAPFISKLSVISNKLSDLKNNLNSSNSYNLQPITYNQTPNFFPFSFLFLFWMLLYFGRTTWGGLIDLIPGMKEMHISRFIVGVHLTGMFLIPLSVWWLSDVIARGIWRFFMPGKSGQNGPPAWLWWGTIIITLMVMVPPVYQQTVKYNELNNRLIVQAVENAAKVQTDVDQLMATLRAKPSARIFAGRGGGWGKDFRIAETEMFMYLSTFGLNTVLWLPETWSMNSDIEQYFSEDQAKDYDLFNIRYVVAKPDFKPQSFWREIKRGETWVLYEVATSGYFAAGTRTMTVVSDKYSLINITRQWIQSQIPTQGLYPEIAFRAPAGTAAYRVPVIKMLDEVTYQNQQGGVQNIWAINPIRGGEPPAVTVLGPETVDTDQIFKTTVKAEPNCRECIVVLKQTYHPNWRATLNGKPVKPMIVFPFFIGIPLATSGTFDLVVSYEPSRLKVFLLWLELAVVVLLIIKSFTLNQGALRAILTRLRRKN